MSVRESEKQRKEKERTMHMTARDKGAEWKYGRRDVVTVAESSAAGPRAGGKQRSPCDPTQAQGLGSLMLPTLLRATLPGHSIPTLAWLEPTEWKPEAPAAPKSERRCGGREGGAEGHLQACGARCRDRRQSHPPPTLLGLESFSEGETTIPSWGDRAPRTDGPTQRGWAPASMFRYSGL